MIDERGTNTLQLVPLQFIDAASTAMVCGTAQPIARQAVDARLSDPLGVAIGLTCPAHIGRVITDE